MSIAPLLIPDRYFGQPIPIAPDLNQVVDKVDELVAAVNAGLAVSNAIVGGPKYVRYTSSQYFNVPADALTLDRLDASTILPGNLAVVINPAASPLADTEASQSYVATIVPAATAGAVQVPAYSGAPAGTTVAIQWQAVSTADAFTKLLATELPVGKEKYAGLELRPLLIEIIGGLGSANTVVTTPAPIVQPAAPTNGAVNDIIKEFSFKVNPLYPNYTQYKENGRPDTTAPTYLSAATAYQVGDTVHVINLAGAKKGSLAYYVAGSGNVPDGKVLSNAEPFTGTATTTPSPALTAALAISVASLAAGQPLTYTVKATGGTAGYTYQVVATNDATGEEVILGASASGIWNPEKPARYTIEATVTDSSVPGKTAQASRQVEVTVQASTLALELTSPPPTTTPDRVAISLTYLASFGSGSYLHKVVAKKGGVTYDIGSAATSECALTWAPPAAGTYSITDTVTDGAGATKTSTASTMTVTATAFGNLAYNETTREPSWDPSSPANLADYEVTYLTSATAPAPAETGILYMTVDDAGDKATYFPKPGFLNTLGLWEMTLNGSGPGSPGSGVATPAAPTLVALDDTANTITFRPPTGYINTLTLYEMTLMSTTITDLLAGSTANADGSFTIPIGNIAVGAGQLGVRLKAQGTTPAGTWFYNNANQVFNINQQGQEITVLYNDARITYTPTWDTSYEPVGAYSAAPGLDYYAKVTVTKGVRFNTSHVQLVGNKMDIYVNDAFLQTIIMPAVGQEAFRIAYTDGLTREFKFRANENKPVGFHELYLSV